MVAPSLEFHTRPALVILAVRAVARVSGVAVQNLPEQPERLRKAAAE